MDKEMMKIICGFASGVLWFVLLYDLFNNQGAAKWAIQSIYGTNLLQSVVNTIAARLDLLIAVMAIVLVFKAIDKIPTPEPKKDK